MIRDTVYTVRFDHASLSKEHADSMQVLVNGKPVTMTRVTSNKAGDEQGWTGTSITTHATNTNRFQHDGQWATYEGKVTIPANTPVSTFTFKALNAVDPTKGNLIDNLTFKIAYRLSYDANGGTKKQASRISSKTFGKAKTARTEAIASRASGDELAVNGGFDVPKWSIAKEGQGLPWIYVYADKGVVSSYYQYANGQNGTKMPGPDHIIVRMAGRGRHRRTSGHGTAPGEGREHGRRRTRRPYGRPDGRHYTGSRLHVQYPPLRPVQRQRGRSHTARRPRQGPSHPGQTDPHHGLQDRSEIRGQDPAT